MKRIPGVSVVLTVMLLFSGCAGIYKEVKPSAVNFNNNSVTDGIGFSYKYDVLAERGNVKYAKIERKKGVKLIAVKITNNYDTTLNIGRDIVFYSGNDQLTLLNPYILKQLLKQQSAGYLFYLLLTPFTVNALDYNGRVIQTYPVGLVVGPGLAAANIFSAANANRRMTRELWENNIINRDIKSGETIYGIMGIMDSGFNPISVRLRYPEDQAVRDYYR